jgi:hypothetical protein
MNCVYSAQLNHDERRLKLAKTAMNQLEEQIEAIRQEAYTVGYAAAMQAIREFAGGSSAAGATQRKQASGPAVTAKPRSVRAVAKASKAPSSQRTRAQRGSNVTLIAEVLKRMPNSSRAADIRKALQRDKGVSIAFTSIRHALEQLAQRGEVEASADRKTWHYVEATSP